MKPALILDERAIRVQLLRTTLGGSILSAAGVVPDAFFVLLRFGGAAAPASRAGARRARAGRRTMPMIPTVMS
jgi:hypothetical protein